MVSESPRRPWLAMILSMVLPGLGQFYNGEPYKGAAMFALVALTTPVTAFLAVHVWAGRALTGIVILGTLGGLAIYLFAIVDALRTAKSANGPHTVPPAQQVYAYLALFLCGYAFILSPSVAQTKATTLELFKVPTGSMMPALMPGDRFFVDKHVNRPGGAPLWHGAVAILTYPNNRTLMYVKRVIGLPGDHVEIRDTAVSVNGRALQLPSDVAVRETKPPACPSDQRVAEEAGDRGSYFVLWKNSAQRSDFAIDVPPGQVFVLGDNRDRTEDSRQFGVVPLSDIVGVARQTLVSVGDAGMDWGSVGRAVR